MRTGRPAPSHRHGNTHEHTEHDYIPAAGPDRFLRFYDPLTRLLGAERVRARLLDAANVQPGERVLDLGCGTGALAALKQRQPAAQVVGLDPDAKALGAEQKRRWPAARSSGGRATRGVRRSPRAASTRSSRRCVHHLTSEQKARGFGDILRLLRPGAAFHLLDFGPPRGAFERGLTAIFHHGERIGDNLGGRLPEWLNEAGFEGVREVESHRTLFGRVSLYSARAPD